MDFLIGLTGVVALLAQAARMVGVPYPIFRGQINADVRRRVERGIGLEQLRQSG